MSTITRETLWVEILKATPEFEPAGYPGDDSLAEGLAHVVMGYYTSFVVDAYQRAVEVGRWDGTSAFERAVEVLERAVTSGDEYVENVVAVSFLENLDKAGDDRYRLRRRLGPALRRGSRWI